MKSKLSRINKIIFASIFILLVYVVGKAYSTEISNINYPYIDAWENELTGDCAVVLTGGPGRLKEGFDMLVRGQIQKLIVSGVHPHANVQELFPQLILFPQVAEKDIVLEKRSETTFGNAQQTLPLIEALQCKSVLLVTSYLHMYRAVKTFKATYPQDITLIPYSVNGSQIQFSKTEIFLESTKSLFYSFWAYRQ